MGNLEAGKYYHIYNKSINNEILFHSKEDYMHFLSLYGKYIYPVANTCAWALMKNHFHFLVRIKESHEIGFYKPKINPSEQYIKFQTIAADNLSEFEEPDRVNLRVPNPCKHFSHLFNAYSKYYNIHLNRSGSLFKRPFQRKSIQSEEYLKNLIIYIHTNPVHHGLCNKPELYPWTSYNSILSAKTTKLMREKVIYLFSDKSNFIAVHNQKLDTESLKEYLLE